MPRRGLSRIAGLSPKRLWHSAAAARPPGGAFSALDTRHPRICIRAPALTKVCRRTVDHIVYFAKSALA
jgi:hypothetical protein